MRRTLFLVVVVAALAVAGCGSDNKSASQKFSESATKACGRFLQDTRAIKGTGAAKLQQLGPMTARLRAELARLTPPAGKKESFDRYLANLDRMAALINRAAAALERGDRQAAAAAANGIRGLQIPLGGAAIGAGLPRCGNGG
jgi:hypothetical protein